MNHSDIPLKNRVLLKKKKGEKHDMEIKKKELSQKLLCKIF